MKKRFIGITLSMVIGSLTLQGVAFARSKDPHGVHMDAQMKKQHAMMPMFSVASAKLEVALDKGDAASVEVEAGKILAAIPDLKKSKPHKNIKQRKKLVVLAADLEKTVTSTAELAKKGDFAGAKASLTKVEEVCAACHAKFRD